MNKTEQFAISFSDSENLQQLIFLKKKKLSVSGSNKLFFFKNYLTCSCRRSDINIFDDSLVKPDHRVPNPVLPLSNCATPDQLLNLSVLQFLHILKIGKLTNIYSS